jgi:hypothetical protein
MPKLLDRHPWLPFVLAFLLLIAAWGVLILLALRHQPEEVPLEMPARSE